MFTKRSILRTAGASLAATICLAAQSVAAQTSSESKAIEDLKRQVAELQKEVTSLKQHPAPADGPMTTEVVRDGKTYVERSVPVEKSAADKWKLSSSLTELEIYGDIRLRYQYNGGEPKAGVQ